MLVQSKTLGIINDKYVEAIYESSNILMSTYFPEKNKLFIHFSRGGTYSYSNIRLFQIINFVTSFIFAHFPPIFDVHTACS